jgi:tRNA dimethylallyltransferase
VVDGWAPPEVNANPRLRQALEGWAEEVGALGLYERLAVLDPAAAQKIDYHNVRRTVRALEVIFSTGRPFSLQRASAPSPYQSLQIGLIRPRPELYARIDARIDQMLVQGLVEETRRLLEQGYSRRLPALSAIGYREMAAYLEGEISFDEAVLLIRRNTRTYVRRQNTWFKPNDPAIHWFEMDDEVVDRIARLIENTFSLM